MKKTITVMVLAFIMALSVSCEYDAEREKAVIVDVFEQSNVMGTTWKTTVKCADGTTATLEGKYGGEGDTIWVKRMTSKSDSSITKITVE